MLNSCVLYCRRCTILPHILDYTPDAPLWSSQTPGFTPIGKPNVGQAYVFAVLIFVFPLVGAVALVHSNRVAIQIQIKLRAQLTSAVYRKALRLSSRSDASIAGMDPRSAASQNSLQTVLFFCTRPSSRSCQMPHIVLNVGVGE